MLASFPEFFASGGNRHPSAADYDRGTGILAYGADRNIALWRPNAQAKRGVYALLKGHEGAVNTVKFHRAKLQDRGLLLSGAGDKTIRVWRQNSKVDFMFHECTRVEIKSSPNALACPTNSQQPIFISASADCTLRLWRFEVSDEQVQIHVLQEVALTPSYLPLAIDLLALEDSRNFVIIVGGTNSQIQVFASPTDSLQFKVVASLTGHEGWIRSLAFKHSSDSGDVLFASASQDKFIRLWRLHQGKEPPRTSIAANESLLKSVDQSLSNRAHRFISNDREYSITFEALLVGHEDWVYTAQWDSNKLLTSSADNSLSIWELDETSEVWACSTRLGEISSQKGATTATGSSGGYWIGLWADSAVLSLGRTGAWRKWNQDREREMWTQEVAVTGHTREVRDISWSKDGTYLLSTGSDQTTRLFARWREYDTISWHEISRPQVHGYDLNCISALGELMFISGADEKLLRVFKEPSAVAALLSGLDAGNKDVERGRNGLPETAEIPVMGLSNKAINDESDPGATAENEENSTTTYKHWDVGRPPVEDQLGRHLLWPEIEKLYGHGYEISALATSHDGAVIATACRASAIEHAVIRLYDTRTWQEVKPPLRAHSLTVYSLAFSEDDQYLLSVGRDRLCCIWSRNDKCVYSLLASHPKAHSRMILDCAWLSKEPDRPYFATAGRDKCLRIWVIETSTMKQVSEVAFDSPVTAIDSLYNRRPELLLALGFEDGSISIATCSVKTFQVNENPVGLPSSITPSKAITSMAWRPTNEHRSCNGSNQNLQNNQQLAIASEDTSVRIISVQV